MGTYTVRQLARLSGVSVRTLHHYDDIGLLKPAFTGENRYRYYGRDELVRLQDILFYRELGVPLQEIARVLANEGRDRLAVLTDHRQVLARQVEHSRQLLQTIDRTIAELNGDGTMQDKDLYKGFSPGKQAEYEDWLVDRYGGDMRERIEKGKARVASLGNDWIAAQREEATAVFEALAEAFNAETASEDLAMNPLLARHRECIATMWGGPCTIQAYAGVADLYLDHPDFRKNMDKRGEGFTEWLSASMKAYAARMSA